MDDKVLILAVDDDLFQRDLAEDFLGDDYQVVCAEDGASALMLALERTPGLILLDVEMPGMDGYETCREFRQEEVTATVPVIFVSAHDRIEERLKGYEAGGDDYVTKPFDPQELKAKIAHLLNMVAERGSLKAMASYATNTAMTAMTSMSEMGGLLESLKSFNASIDENGLAEAVIAGLAPYDLSGVVQIRTPEKMLTITGQGEASPLEASVINHMADMDRITQFKNRLSIHYEHVSLLVNNMPVQDPDRCGRLRDHLAMLLEGAEARARGIIAEKESRRRGLAIEHMIERVTEALNGIDAAQRQSRMEARMAFSALTDKMENALLNVALTREQEDFLSSIVTGGIEDIINVQSAEADLQNKLTSIVHEMKEVSEA